MKNSFRHRRKTWPYSLGRGQKGPAGEGVCVVSRSTRSRELDWEVSLNKKTLGEIASKLINSSVQQYYQSWLTHQYNNIIKDLGTFLNCVRQSSLALPSDEHHHWLPEGCHRPTGNSCTWYLAQKSSISFLRILNGKKFSLEVPQKIYAHYLIEEGSHTHPWPHYKQK